MSTITDAEREKICEFVKTHHIPRGLGTPEEACSIAAINLALTGCLTDEIPNCMSRLMGHWIIIVQDAMPDAMRNSLEWKQLLPYAAGTGRKREHERLNIILDWMWNSLAFIQPVADAHKFGQEWSAMMTEKIPRAAYRAACAASQQDFLFFADAAYNASEAVSVRGSAAYRGNVGMHDTAVAATNAVVYLASSNHIIQENFWASVDPIGTLRKLILVSEQVPEIELC